MRILHERFIPALFGNERHKAGNVGQLSAICHLPSSPRPSLPFCPLLHSVKKLSAAPCILKTRAILIPLEVYMVNSPSRPILRPDAPPNPVECGGRTPLWNRETCLPAHRMPVRNQTKSNHQASASRHLPLCMFFAIAPPLPSRSPNSETPTRFFPIKAKTPLIVHHQGISRQTLKFLNAVVGRVTPCAPSWPTKPTTIGNHPHGKSGHSRWQAAAGTGLPALPCHPFSRDSRISRLPFPQSRQKPLQSCLIKAHQGIHPKKHLPRESSPKLGDGKAKLPPPIPFASLR